MEWGWEECFELPSGSPMELERRIGTVLCGKWTLERLLGSGGMAAVYAASHKKIGRRDAIKILHADIARVPELRARFDQEAYAANRFVHRGAVEIRDIDVTEDGCPFLVMELLEGESLRARCDRLGPPDIAEVLRIADDLLDVLAAAHAHGIIHRDVKPENIFCLPDGRIKVLDFGVAHVRQAASSLRTRTGAMLGTVAYMPPEQVKGKDIDARADVFAVGATMFRLIAGRHVHETHSDADLLVKMTTAPAPPLASVAHGAPQGVSAIVDRALAFDREERYPTAAAMQQDVRAVRSGRQPEIALGMAHRVRPPAPRGGAVDYDAPTVLQVKGAVPAQPALAPMTPEAAPFAVAPPPRRTALTQQLTQWTVTTVGERRLRWIALAFPLIGAAVLAVVFYGATHVEREEPTRVAAGSPAAAEAPVEQVATTVATPSSAETPRTEPEETPPEPETEPAEPENETAAPRSNRTLSCFETKDCKEACHRKCTKECTDPSGCTIGALPGAKVRCTGPERCEVSCAGKCKVHCNRGAPCLVHCAPGFECELEDCPTEVEACTSILLACGTPCPG